MQPPSGIRYYTQAAVLIALAIVIRRFIVPQQMFGLNLGGLPLILAGFVLGPWGGALVGAVSDVIGVLFTTTGFTPLVTVTSALTGALPAAVVLLLPLEQRKKLWCLGLSIACGQFVTKVLLLPWILFWSFGRPVQVTMWHHLIEQLWHVPLYTMLLHPLLRAYQEATGRPAAVLLPARHQG